jgi:hypothetical protein
MFEIGMTYSIIAGIMSIALLIYSVHRKHEHFFLFSLIFLIASWSGLEWALWLRGSNMFHMIFKPIVPFAFYFVAWIALVVYVSEKIFKKRKYWVGFIGVLLIITAIASVCMNCLYDFI